MPALALALALVVGVMSSVGYGVQEQLPKRI